MKNYIYLCKRGLNYKGRKMIRSEAIPAVMARVKGIVRLHVNSIYTYYGQPYATNEYSSLNAELNQCEFKEEIYYTNNTFRDVSVMNRNGMAITIPKSTSINEKDFIIRKIIKLKNTCLMSAIDSINSLKNIDDSELEEIRESLINYNQQRWGNMNIMIEYKIPIEEISTNGDSMYHYPTDLVISLNSSVDMVAHPYSARFLDIGSFGVEHTFTNQKELNLKIRYVSYDLNASPLYINLAGKVLKLNPQNNKTARRILSTVTTIKNKPIKPPDFSSYVQVFYSSHLETEKTPSEGVTALRYSLEEAKIKLGLYDTYAEAINNGNTEAIRKQELVNLMHEAEKTRHNNVIEKARLDAEDIERKRVLANKEHAIELLKKDLSEKDNEVKLLLKDLDLQIAKQKEFQTVLDNRAQELDNERTLLNTERAEQDSKLEREKLEFKERLNSLREENENRIKNEQMFWKDHYEQKAAQRKDTSDFVKFIPGLVLGVVGVVGVWAKMHYGNKST